MTRTLVAILLIAAVVYTTCALPQHEHFPKNCGPNEEFDACISACEPTCEQPTPSICTLQCNIGCKCKDGYMKNSAGSCVLPEHC